MILNNMSIREMGKAGLRAAGMVTKSKLRGAGLSALILAACALTGLSGQAGAQNTTAKSAKESPSDAVADLILSVALTNMPDFYTDKAGKKVSLDIKKPHLFIITRKDAKPIIRAGFRSGHAQLCGFTELRKKNYDKMFQNEKKRGKWGPAQFIFIDRVHFAARQLAIGELKLKSEGMSEKEAAKLNPKPKCEASDKPVVRKRIEDYLKT